MNKKTKQQWREYLSEEEFAITRNKGTERAFSNPLNDEYRIGAYHCLCCDTPLFTSATKFNSGTGWPSFFAPINDKAISEHKDNSLFTQRTEVRCTNCDAHLGHVFPDGPKPTGLRYCLNGSALKFKLNSSKPI